MSFIVLPSKKLRKLLKKCQRSGREDLIESVREVADLLAIHDSRALFVLYERWRDHALKGNRTGIRELHLTQDNLLLYVVDEESRTVALLDIVTHEELRKKK